MRMAPNKSPAASDRTTPVKPSLGVAQGDGPAQPVTMIAFMSRLLGVIIPPPKAPRHDEIREVVKSVRIGYQQLFFFHRADNNMWLNKPYHSTTASPLLSADIIPAARLLLDALNSSPAVSTVRFEDEHSRRIDLARLADMPFDAALPTMVAAPAPDDDEPDESSEDTTEDTTMGAPTGGEDDLADALAAAETTVEKLNEQVGVLEAKQGRLEGEIIEQQIHINTLYSRLDSLEAAAKRKVTVKIEDEDEDEAGPSAPTTPPPEPAPAPEPRPSRMAAARAKRARKA